MTLHGDVRSDTALSRQFIVTNAELGMGATAPTSVSVGVTPAVPALLFDAVAETVEVAIQMPSNWDHTIDVDLVMTIEWVVPEVNGDVLGLTVDYVVPLKNNTGNGAAKASTQIMPTLTATTANGLATGDRQEFRMTFAANDATNPFLSDTDAVGFELSLHLTDLVGVGAFHLFSSCVAYEARH